MTQTSATTQNAPIQNEPNDAPFRRTVSKDLSLVSLVPKWSGGETALPINEFFEILEGSAAIGNWTEADQKQVFVLKLTDAARAFYSATLCLRFYWPGMRRHVEEYVKKLTRVNV